MEEYALAQFHLNRFAVAKHVTVDGEGRVTDFIAVRHAFGERRLHGCLALLFQSFHFGSRSQHVLPHVTTAAVTRLEFLQNQEDLTVVISRLMLRLNVNMSNLAGVLAGRKIRTSTIVGVIEAIPRGPGYERDTPLPMGGNIRGAFLGGPVHLDRNELPMPMQLFRGICVVLEVDGHLLSLLEPEERSRKLAVVSRDRNDLLRRNLDRRSGNSDGVISRILFPLRISECCFGDTTMGNGRGH